MSTAATLDPAGISPGDPFQSIVQGYHDPTLDDRFPFYPLLSPELALPGTNFIRCAVQLGDPQPEFNDSKGAARRLTAHGHWLHYLYRRALYDETFQLDVDVRNTRLPAKTVPGHLFGDDIRGCHGGPRKADVMVIGKHPGQEELARQRNFVGPTSEEFFRALSDLDVPETEWANWYVTNLVKWSAIDPQSSSLPAAWIQDCRILLEQELRFVRPRFILFLGSESSKAVLGTPYSVSAMNGRVMPVKIPIYDTGEEPQYVEAQAMTVYHPAYVYREPEMYDEWLEQLSRFVKMVRGAAVQTIETDKRHEVVYTERHLARIVHEIRSDPNPMRRIIALDGEWHGQYPHDDNAYLRTVQFSSAPKEGICVVLRHDGGVPAFQPAISRAVDLLNLLLQPDPASNYFPRIGGHFLRADLPWFHDLGIDLRKSYEPSDDLNDHAHGGWETGLAYHAINEATSYKLEDIAMRLTTAPRYDTALRKYVNAYCKHVKLKDEELEGYGMIPEWILHPRDPRENNYAAYDPDCARRIIMRCMFPDGDRPALLDHDRFGNNSWTPYLLAHRASAAFLEMEMNGITLDRKRIDDLTEIFMATKDRLLAELRSEINWPAFNPASTPQRCAFLFGDRFGTKKDKTTGGQMPVRPAGALSLNLRPIKSTGKRSKMWAQVVARREEHKYTPSTDKETMGILGHQYPLVMKLRQTQFISHVLRSSLRPPRTDDDDQVIIDEDGFQTYSKGLPSYLGKDGKIHTHLFQTKETGRASSARPALQNLAKKREDDYKKIIGPAYTTPIRTMIRASPGHVLVEADLTAAELAAIAWLSQDPTMIEHISRNILPEDHPDHYDIHSHTAVRAFGLTCAPNKKGLKDAGCAGMRVAAKNVNFGIPYGRSAEAIARQCAEEGQQVSTAETQKLMDFYFEQYPGTYDFLTNCENRVLSPGWLCTTFRRLRRFIPAAEESVLADQKRQARNFPIQGSVADTVSIALFNLWRERERLGDPTYFRFLLQIHDAILFEVPIARVPQFVQETLPKCMIHDLPIWPLHLDGSPIPVTTPYRFGIDTEVALNWGQKITPAMAAEIGLDLAALH